KTRSHSRWNFAGASWGRLAAAPAVTHFLRRNRISMNRPFSFARKLALVIAGCAGGASLSFGQTLVAQANPDVSKITVSVDGLTCGSQTTGTFEGLSFNIAVTDAIISTAGG